MKPIADTTGGDAAEHPQLSPGELERRYCRRMRALKDARAAW